VYHNVNAWNSLSEVYYGGTASPLLLKPGGIALDLVEGKGKGSGFI